MDREGRVEWEMVFEKQKKMDQFARRSIAIEDQETIFRRKFAR